MLLRSVLGIFLLASGSLSAQDTTRLSLLFVGDIMQHDSNIAAAYDPGLKRYDYSTCFEYVAPILRSADLTIGNLELTLAGAPYKGYPQFSAPDALAVELKQAGFDILVTANNHSLDRRRKGLERTISVLDSLQILHTGTFKDSAERATTYPLVVEKNGFRLSLLNYTYGTNGIPVTRPNIVNLIDTLVIKADLAKARNQMTDAIVVVMHWGAEYQSQPNSEQKRLAALCFREGARLVIGAHPHVLQPIIWNQDHDQLVAYSLGNFVSGQRPRYRDGGAMMWIDLQKVTVDSSSRTSIAKAEYELEWVQKSTDFVIRPLRYFDQDTLLIKDPASRNALSVFAHDSRTLYQKFNLGVNEHKVLAAEPVYTIRVDVEPDSTQWVDPILTFYGMVKMETSTDDSYWSVGTFHDLELAHQALLEIQLKTTLRRARVFRRVEEAPVSGQ